MKKKFIIFLFAFLLVSGYTSDSIKIKATTSSSESNDLNPTMMFDGDMSTRWSSEFNDNEWVIIELSQPTKLSEMKIYWEDAYAQSYKVYISDRDDWREIFHTDNSDGGKDIIDIENKKLKKIKIETLKRATGWGNSILEIELFDNDGNIINSKTAFTAREIVDFNSIDGWKTIQSDGSEVSIKSVPGKTGNAIAVDLDITQDNGYVLITKNIPLKLSGNFKFEFFIKSNTANTNVLEFKLVDDSGNTWWKRLVDFPFTENWQKVTIFKNEIIYGWGPDQNKSLTETARLEIGVSSPTGTKQVVYIDELKIVPLKNIQKKVFIDDVKITSSATQTTQPEHQPENALDGDMKTRWASPASDPQWIKFDLNKEKEIAGLIIYWETAYGKSYDILVSNDDKEWRQVYTTENGDGNSDILFFPAETVRYVKIYGRKRGTGWGYSIWEVELLPASRYPSVSASSNSDNAINIMDGNPKTVWESIVTNKHELLIDLKDIMQVGGLILPWKDSVIKNRKVSFSTDKSNWQTVFESKKLLKTTDYVYVNPMGARYIKIEVDSQSDKVVLEDIIIKGAEEKLTVQKTFEIAALQAPIGYYPRWLRNRQEYWTIVGVTDDDVESLVSEDGVIEPWHGSHIYAPVIQLDGDLITYGTVKETQQLIDDYLPVPRVIWESEKLDLIIDVFAAGKGQQSSTYLKYTVKNKTDAPLKGSFFLLVRPYQLNPPWMHGGLTDIKKVEYDSKQSKSIMKINDRNVLYVPVSPEGYYTANYKHQSEYGDIIEDIAGNSLNKGNKLFEDPDGKGSAALEYTFNIDENQSQSFYFIIPLHDKKYNIDWNIKPAKLFESERNKILKFWRDKLASIKIDVPDAEFINTLKSNVAYILINDDSFRLQPGSRNYEASWMRDGSVTATALLRFGYNTEVERYLNWFSKFVKEDGWVPFIVEKPEKIVTHGWKEFDSQGQYIYSLYQYYLYTKDKQFLIDKKQKIIDDIKFIVERLNERKTDEYKTDEKKEFYGIFPESASHEGYIDPPRHSYWDDFWGLRGLNDAIKIFELLGDDVQVEKTKKLRDEFQKDFYNSVRLVAKKKGIKNIAGCADLGDCDPTSTAIGMWPCNEMNNMPKDLRDNTFEIYWTELSKRFKDNWQGAFTPYEMRNANAFMLLGQHDKLHKMLTKFFEWKRPRPWNHWAEVVTAEYRLAQYLGDMPHTWIGAGYVNVIRNMFIYEAYDELTLCKGVPPEWIESGKSVSVTDMPTYFGNINYEIVAEDNIVVNISGDIKGYGKLVFDIPIDSASIDEITVNGKAYSDWSDGKIHIDGVPCEIVIEKNKH